MSVSVAVASEISLPRTGQSTSYASGDDGAIRAGTPCPLIDFTDNGNGTVTDNLTGLIWLKNANCFGSRSWSDALAAANGLASGACGLTDGSTAGQWRLPNVNELGSIMNPGLVRNLMDRVVRFDSKFTNFAGEYWSSTTAAFDTASAWTGIALSGVAPKSKSTATPVWPVRDGAAGTVRLPATGQTTSYAAGDDGAVHKGVPWPAPRFADNGNGTVTDMLTGLMWLKQGIPCYPNVYGMYDPSAPPKLTEGNCGLTDGSALGDWRMPNLYEIRSLLNYGEANQSNWLLAVAGIPLTGSFWSSSSGSDEQWLTGFPSGTMGSVNWTFQYFRYPTNNLLAVRGGQFGTARMSAGPPTAYFYNIPPGESGTRTIAIANSAASGSTRLQINSITLSGTDASDFSLNPGDGTGGTCGTVVPIIPAGGSCTITATFSPTASGSRTATLRISGSDSSGPNTDIILRGNALTVTASVTGGSGTITSTNPFVVDAGAAAFFTLSPAATYTISPTVTGTCPPGSFNGSTYTTGAVDSDCTVGFSFSPPPSCSTNSDCGSAQYCARPVATCGGAGICVGRPGGCPTVYLPVCGCDGITYGNDCEAAGAGVPVAFSDACTCAESVAFVSDGSSICWGRLSPDETFSLTLAKRIIIGGGATLHALLVSNGTVEVDGVLVK